MKYLGIVLILAGVFLVFYAMFFSMEIFFLEKEPPEIFKADDLPISQEHVEEEVEEESALTTEELSEKIDVEDFFPINEVLNVLAAAVFSGIIIFGGSKLAIIGVSIIS